MIKKAVKVGTNSLMIIIDRKLVDKMNIKEDDMLVVDIVRNLKRGYKE